VQLFAFVSSVLSRRRRNIEFWNSRSRLELEQQFPGFVVKGQVRSRTPRFVSLGKNHGFLSLVPVKTNPY
jgi:hypothetical protein